MKRHTKISVLMGVITVLVAALFLTACGGDEAQKTTATQIVCDEKAPSIIPPPSGRPLMVEFFRDT